jgi:hypothetical protein
MIKSGFLGGDNFQTNPNRGWALILWLVTEHEEHANPGIGYWCPVYRPSMVRFLRRCNFDLMAAPVLAMIFGEVV